jgi:hypothetical protein
VYQEEKETLMPYIDKNRRIDLAPEFLVDFPSTPGELNFVITDLLLSYIDDHSENRADYAKYNEVVGVLECLKLEFYRRAVAPYEDKKIAQNGDVYV